jgi:hypothetical protein
MHSFPLATLRATSCCSYTPLPTPHATPLNNSLLLTPYSLLLTHSLPTTILLLLPPTTPYANMRSVRMTYFLPLVTALPSCTRLPSATPCGNTNTEPCRGYGIGYMVHYIGYRGYGIGYMVHYIGYRGYGIGYMVHYIGYRGYGIGYMVHI